MELQPFSRPWPNTRTSLFIYFFPRQTSRKDTIAIFESDRSKKRNRDWKHRDVQVQESHSIRILSQHKRADSTRQLSTNNKQWVIRLNCCVSDYIHIRFTVNTQFGMSKHFAIFEKSFGITICWNTDDFSRQVLRNWMIHFGFGFLLDTIHPVVVLFLDFGCCRSKFAWD